MLGTTGLGRSRPLAPEPHKILRAQEPGPQSEPWTEDSMNARRRSIPKSAATAASSVDRTAARAAEPVAVATNDLRRAAAAAASWKSLRRRIHL